ncbi:MAG: Asp-tRNA(Asn)/Glu-tRNA(Gln) amidotransferase subunit GatC [Candidatus Brockarchaeota archaeon]|nr:Asp-tRNA(Asn)/Glu-tRNA(Gln) amidotransferase subunit GatC [Candidatus Brockarchaeota archaeon]
MAEGSAGKRFTVSELRKYASLAKIKLQSSEEVRLASELGRILSYFEQIKEVDTEGVEPTYSVTGAVNRLREDRPGPCLSQDEATANAAEKERGYVKSPKAF